MKVSFTTTTPTDAGQAWIVPVFTDKDLRGALAPAMMQDLADTLAISNKFSGKTGEVLTVPMGGRIKNHVVFIGMGRPETVTALSCEAAGSAIARAMASNEFANVTLLLGEHPAPTPIPATNMAAHIAQGAMLKSYAFNKYKTAKKNLPVPALTVQLARDADMAGQIYAPMNAVNKSVFFARDLANEPPNELFPEIMTNRIRTELSALGVKIDYLNVREMEQEGMGALLAVGKGSAREPRLVVMEYDGTNGADKSVPLALVGKGVTFDTGGYSIKPAANMDAMKFDMGGAAAVVGAMRAIAARKANVRVVAAVGLAENMISGNAYRPGDIVRSMSGKTIEINNTDAEGRLILADAMTYIQQRFNPRAMIDLATLTGACRVALGTAYAGLFSDDEDFAAEIMKSGKAVHENAWPLPLHEIYNKAMKDSHYADLINSASIGGSASTAAEFLSEFVNNGVRWAHLDIAAMASGAKNHPARPDVIGNGFGVRLLDRLIADYFETKSALVIAPRPVPVP